MLALLAVGAVTLCSRAYLSPAVAFAQSPAASGTPTLPLHSDPVHEDGMRLGRAALERSLGHTQEVIAQLEGIDYSIEPRFAEADRAAFLLGQAYLEAGSHERFAQLARAVAGWRMKSVYTQWIAFQALLAETQGSAPAAAGAPAADFVGPLAPDSAATREPVGMGAADVLAASILLQQGNSAAAFGMLDSIEARGDVPALAGYLRALSGGAADSAALARLASGDTSTALGRDLAGAARIRLAVMAIAGAHDPAPLLEGISPRSRYAARARHMAGIYALERGSLEGGQQILESLLASDSGYVARREVQMALAGQALAHGDWGQALARYQEIDRDWNGQKSALERILPEHRLDQLWRSWSTPSPLSDVLTLDALPAQMLAERLATASTDLGSRPTPASPDLGAPVDSTWLRWPVAPPPPALLREVVRSGARVDEVGYERDLTRRAADDERASLADLRRYLGLGLDRATRERDTLQTQVARMDSLVSVLDQVDARLRAVRDEAKRRVGFRAARARAIAERQLAWVRAMRRFYLEGPHLERPLATPPGFPSADSLTRIEESLAATVESFARHMVADTPDLLDRSYQHAWRPGLIDRAQTNRAEVWRLLTWAQRLDPSIQIAMRATGTSPRLEELVARVASLERSADSARVADLALRETVAREAIANALTAIQTEREGIDYGLAAATYAQSVGLSADSATVAAGADTAADDPQAAARRLEAIATLQGFLAHHPESGARGEMRFRLADLVLTDARANFRGQMAHYLAEQSAGRPTGPVPVLSYAPAYRLYQSILAEDRDYPHLDAVLFNTGMILSDEGNPDAERYFQELVTTHADSRYAQESWARMGDQHFQSKDFAGCIPLYEHAAAGKDLTLRAISLYKLGWARFNGEQFPEAATAFQAVMDVYDSTQSQRIDVDLQGEAEAYLIHSLARAGGAEAFAQHFDASGGRPYERRVLRGLGMHFRKYSLYAEAAETEKLYLQRYPHDPEALESAERLADTYERWNRPELARTARLENAARFAPRSEWADAQQSDSVRTAGASFSKASWTAVAKHHHLLAREKGAVEDWREALRLYQQILVFWPQDGEAPLYELYSGEASAHLNDHEAARAHYANAARTGADSVASEALWQRVAVTDAWYEKSRAAKAGTTAGLGSDSLAQAVLSASDELMARYPNHAHGADASWRTGHLALAHGWNERAAADFGALATRYPRDSRGPAARVLQADAWFQVGRFEDAGKAYEAALTAATQAGSDSLAKKAAAAIPVTYYRLAEASVAADSTAYERHAELFQQVAKRWPSYEYAHLAQYRAGLAYARAGKTAQSVTAMQSLIQNFPKSEYVKDAHLQIAKTWEGSNQPAKAGEAYAEFAKRYPKDESAAGATLKAADLLTTGGQEARADTLRLAYVRQYPNDVETAMEIYETLARRDLKSVSPQHPISALLAPGKPVASKTRRGKPTPTPNPSFLAEYLRRAQVHPKLASQSFIAEVRFRQGEEAYASYDSVRLGQPLAKSIPVRQKRLDSLMVAYRRCADVGDPAWARASAFRIGEALVAFGQALERSERPADLQGEDLRGYDDVLTQQAQAFYDRGEGVWSDLLKKGRDVTDDPWIGRAQTALWGRLGGRFYFKPEVDYPLVDAGSAPERVKPAEKADKKKDKDKAERSDPLRTVREQIALSSSPYWPYRLSEAHYQAGTSDSAELYLKRSVARDSSYAPALSLLGKLYFDTHRYQQGVDLLEAARSHASDFPQTLMVGLALQYDAMEQPEQSRSVMVSSGKPEKIKGSAGAYLALRGPQPDEAAPIAESAVLDHSSSAANQNNYGITKLRAGDPVGARRAFAKAMELDPKLPGPYYNLTILEKYFAFDDDAASKSFQQYWSRSHADPDRIAQAFGVGPAKDLAEKKD